MSQPEILPFFDPRAADVPVEVMAGIVALNHERAREEAEGHVRWLAPHTTAQDVARAVEKAKVRRGR